MTPQLPRPDAAAAACLLMWLATGAAGADAVDAAVQAGSGPVAARAAFEGRLQCAERVLGVVLVGEALRLSDGARHHDLRQVRAASGVKYEAPGDASTFAWLKGRRATVAIGGVPWPACGIAEGEAQPFRAVGHEPAWALEVTAERLRWRGAGSAVDAELPPFVAVADGRRYDIAPADGAPALAVTVHDAPCVDAMTGLPFPHRVEVAVDGQPPHAGCGGDPRMLLQDVVWQVQALDGRPPVPGSRMTIAFGELGRASGEASCNRWASRWALSAEGLRIERPAASRRGCAPALMAQEARFVEALGQVRRVTLAPDGTLVLEGEGRRIDARQP